MEWRCGGAWWERAHFSTTWDTWISGYSFSIIIPDEQLCLLFFLNFSPFLYNWFFLFTEHLSARKCPPIGKDRLCKRMDLDFTESLWMAVAGHLVFLDDTFRLSSPEFDSIAKVQKFVSIVFQKLKSGELFPAVTLFSLKSIFTHKIRFFATTKPLWVKSFATCLLQSLLWKHLPFIQIHSKMLFRILWTIGVQAKTQC